MSKSKEKTNMDKSLDLQKEFVNDLKRTSVLSPEFVRQVEAYMMTVHRFAFGAGVDARIKLKKGESYSS